MILVDLIDCWDAFNSVVITMFEYVWFWFACGGSKLFAWFGWFWLLGGFCCYGGVTLVEFGWFMIVLRSREWCFGDLLI